jgi:hypothetical protein
VTCATTEIPSPSAMAWLNRVLLAFTRAPS